MVWKYVREVLIVFFSVGAVFIFFSFFVGIIGVLGYMYNWIIVIYGYINKSLLLVILGIILEGVLIFVVYVVIDLFSWSMFGILIFIGGSVVIFIAVFGMVFINVCERLVIS